MMQCEGYKMFHGTMRITPMLKALEPREMTGTWLYKPEFDCWYALGHSFPAEICEVVQDDAE
jgi:hypothetical protein